MDFGDDFNFDGVDLNDASGTGGMGDDSDMMGSGSGFRGGGDDFGAGDLGADFGGTSDLGGASDFGASGMDDDFDTMLGNGISGQSNGDPNSGQFTDSFDDPNNGDFSDTPSSGQGFNKKYIIAIAAGVAIILLACIIGIVVKNKKNKDSELDQLQAQQQTQTQVKSTETDADKIMQSGNTQGNTGSTGGSTSSTKYTVDENNFNWIELSGTDDITFEGDYKEMTFTITGIDHYARKVDESGTMEVKSVLTGSIGGLPGTYTINIPYEKGVQLQQMDQKYLTITVQILLGDYKGQTVVGDIRY